MKTPTDKPDSVDELLGVLKRVHTMGMSDQLIGVKEHYYNGQLETFALGIRQWISDAVNAVEEANIDSLGRYNACEEIRKKLGL